MTSRGEKAEMYYPHFKKNRRNVPILSKIEINIIAERFAREFMPQILENPQPFNIDGFIEAYLNLQLDYQYLSHDGRYLGMTVFNDTDKVIVYLPECNQADYIHVNHGTVIIDNSLLEDRQEHRYRFTLGHEGGHWILHNSYFGYNPNQLSLFESNTPFIQCRETNRNYLYSATNRWDETRWMEWHADKFSAGILMPESAVHHLLNDLNSNPRCSTDEYRTKYISDTFNVSEQAAYLRLFDLGYIRKTKDASEYQQLSFL